MRDFRELVGGQSRRGERRGLPWRESGEVEARLFSVETLVSDL